jgi:DNA-binding Lrp family transcriptional regulator
VIAAYVRIQTEAGQAVPVAAALRAVAGVSDAATVTGPYDVIVRAEVRDIDELGRLVVSPVQALGGAAPTLTCPELPHDLRAQLVRSHQTRGSATDTAQRVGLPQPAASRPGQNPVTPSRSSPEAS